MPHPLVVNMLEEKFDVYVGRPSRWGNPFRLRRFTMRDPVGVRQAERRIVLVKYEQWLLTQDELLGDIPELRGKVLGCYCAPLECHGDILARLANG